MCACLPLSPSPTVLFFFFFFFFRVVHFCSSHTVNRFENKLCVKVMARCLYPCVCRSPDSDMNGKTGSRGPVNSTVEANSNANNLSMASHSIPEAQNHSQVSILQYTVLKKQKTGEQAAVGYRYRLCLKYFFFLDLKHIL